MFLKYNSLISLLFYSRKCIGIQEQKNKKNKDNYMNIYGLKIAKNGSGQYV